MDKTLKFLITILLSTVCYSLNAQFYKEAPKDYEEVVGRITDKVFAGSLRYRGGDVVSENGKNVIDKRIAITDDELWFTLEQKAKAKYGSKYPKTKIRLRAFTSRVVSKKIFGPEHNEVGQDKYYKISAKVVVKTPNNNTNNSKRDERDPLSKALDKVLQDISEGSKIAIDQVRVPSDTDRSEYKDKVVEGLLDRGYKVVAKEHLEKLFEEQQAQQSGIYNARTTVKNNNFSAVGYFINVRLTESSLRVQIINVSTGEYDANVNITL